MARLYGRPIQRRDQARRQETFALARWALTARIKDGKPLSGAARIRAIKKCWQDSAVGSDGKHGGSFHWWKSLGEAKVDNDHDLPYLAGYSEDGMTIYFDRHLPEKLEYEYDGIKRFFDPRDFIRIHEETEKTGAIFGSPKRSDAGRRGAYRPSADLSMSTRLTHDAMYVTAGMGPPCSCTKTHIAICLRVNLPRTPRTL
jgi:hypothetical protein